MKTRLQALTVCSAVLLVSVLGCATGCGGSRTPAAPQQSGGTSSATGPVGGASSSAPSWIIAGSTLSRLLATDGTAAAEDFDTPNTFVLTSPQSWSIPAGWTSVPTADFTSYAALRSAIEGGRLDPRFKAVLYDAEQWPLTPSADQHDPRHYYQLAGDLVHRHHLLFIAAPAPDLVDVLSPTSAETQGHYQAFLSLSLASDTARDADVLDLQAQGSEADTALFTSFVAEGAAQARSANPHIRVLAGLSTNPSGKSVTASVVDTAALAVRADVDGYWLNDPVASTACPRCAGPFPQLALAAVQGLTGG